MTLGAVGWAALSLGLHVLVLSVGGVVGLPAQYGASAGHLTPHLHVKEAALRFPMWPICSDTVVALSHSVLL